MGIRQSIPAPLKAKLKDWRGQARAAIVRRFFAFDAKQLVETLRRMGVHPGDTVIAHSSFARFEGFTGRISEAIQALQDAVGQGGTLLMPTIPFSGSALDYVQSGQVTDVLRTPSRMGLLTEVFRRLPGAVRSIHPTHPIAARGQRAAELVADHYRAETPCGKNSPFEKLLQSEGKILLAGVDIRCMTFFHYVEELLELSMPFSPFTTEWFELSTKGPTGEILHTRTRLFDPVISSNRDTRLMIKPLRRAGFWHEGRVGRLSLVVLSAADVVKTLSEMSNRGRYCYRTQSVHYSARSSGDSRS